jgi:hypothetical protein
MKNPYQISAGRAVRRVRQWAEEKRISRSERTCAAETPKRGAGYSD